MTRAAGRDPALDHEGFTIAIPVDLDRAAARLVALGRRFADLVHAIEDPRLQARGLEWTVAETAVHVAQGFEYYAASIRGEPFDLPARADDETFTGYFARLNRLQIDADPERDPAALATRLRSSVEDLAAAALGAGPNHMATFAAGYSEDTTTSVCTIIGELVVHGHDIARATRHPWKIDSEDAVLAVYATTAALSLALDRVAAAGSDIHVRVHLRHGSTFSLRFLDGRVWTEVASDAPPDVHVQADPLAYLMVGYGRDPLWRPALRGQLLVWGRKPWKLLKVPKLLLGP